MRTFFAALSLIVILADFSCAETHAQGVGTLPGDVSVDNKGAAIYSIPLATPPGRAGLEPKLTLTYNSNAGNGLLGLGWALSTGFPEAISRGRSIYARDGNSRGVYFDDGDKLYLDGKRLVCVSGASLSVGSTYRTEVESFVSVEATGIAPVVSGFTATDKVGTKYYFGGISNDIQAVHEAGARGSGRIYRWALRRIVDVVGNTIDFLYDDLNFDGVLDSTELGQGEHVLTEIRYTGHTVYNSQAWAIRYQYKHIGLAGVQPFHSFIAGYKVERKRRLDRIQVVGLKPDTAGVQRQYLFWYLGHGLNTPVQSVFGGVTLKSVHVVTGENGTIVPHTELTYTPDAQIGFNNNSTVAVRSFPNLLYFPVQSAMADFNKDGVADLVYLIKAPVNPKAPQNLCVELSGSGGTYGAPQSIYHNRRIHEVWSEDMDCDGFKDIVFFAADETTRGGGWYIARYNPSGANFSSPVHVFGEVSSHMGAATYRSGGAVIGDVNGDGRPDIVSAVEAHDGAKSPEIWGGYPVISPYITLKGDVYLSNVYVGSIYTEYRPSDRIMPPYTNPLMVMYNQSGSGSMSFSAPTSVYSNVGAAYVSSADFNGDGELDFLLQDTTVPQLDSTTSSSAKLRMWYSRTALIKSSGGSYVGHTIPGSGEYQISQSNMSGRLFGFKTLTGDINGDGLTDILSGYWSQGNTDYPGLDGWAVGISRGDGTFEWDNANKIPIEVTVDTQSVKTFSINTDTGLWFMSQEPGGGDYYIESMSMPEMNGFCLRDINGDGMEDFVWTPYAGGNAPSGHLGSIYCIPFNGSKFDPSNVLSLGHPQESLPLRFSFRQFSKNPNFDLLSVSYAGYPGMYPVVQYFPARTKEGIKLSSVRNGLGNVTEVRYGHTMDPTIYTTGSDVSYPIVENLNHTYVVSDVFKDAGMVDANVRNHFSYQYSGRRTDLSGRGDLGFHSFVTLDHQTNLFKYQFLTQSFPMTGLTAREQTYRYWESGGDVNFRLISSHDNTVVFDEVVNGANISQAYGTVFPFISKAVESRWENSNTAHFTVGKAGSATSKAEALFPVARPAGAHITIRAQSWFDNQSLSTSPPSTLPGPYYASDRTTDWAQAGINGVAGVASYAAFDALNFPRQITYGNLRKLETDFGGGFTEKVETTYEGPTTNGITGKVDTVTTTVTSPDFGTEVAPVKSFEYWTAPGGTTTGLVSSEMIDASDNSLDLTTSYGRDGLGRVTSTSISSPSIGSYTTSTVVSFDARFDLPTVSKNAYGHETTVEYHPFFGLPVSVIDANGAEAETTYDALGRVTQTKDLLRGLQTDYTYAWIIGPMVWDDQSFQACYRMEVTSTAQPKITTYFDRLGRSRVVEKEGFYGQTLSTATAYNALGQVAKEWGYDSRETAYTYDELGRVKTIRHPDWSLTTNVYAGRVTQVQFDGQNTGSGTGAGVQVNTTLVDPKGRTVKVWNADNVPTSLDPIIGSAQAASISFKLDGFGRMRETVLRDQQSQPVTATYDALGRQTALNDPDKGNWSYVNNVFGQVVSQTDANQNVTLSTFDRLGRPLTRTTTEPAGGPIESAAWYYYDLASNVGTYPHLVAKGTEGWIGSVQREESATSNLPGYAAGSASTAYYYDTKGRVSTKLNNIDSKWFYTWMGYDTVNRLKDVRHYWRAPDQENPGDPATSWESFGYTNNYDARSYLTSVVDTQNRTWWEVEPNGGYDWYSDIIIDVRKGSGYWTWKSYDYATGRPVSIDSPIHFFYNEYDGYGNVTHRYSWSPEGDHTDNYSYDILNRLTHHNGQQTTAYHINGNIDWKKDVSGTSSASYAYGSSKPHAVTSAWGYSMSYDNNGNLLTRNGGGQNWITRWAGFDKPRWLAKGSTGSEFHYNANRSRVIHLEFDQMSGSPAIPSHYKSKKIYAAGAEMEVDYKNTSPSGVSWQQDTVRIYIPAPDGIAGTREFRPFAPAGQQEKLLVYHYDTLGSIMAVTPFGDTSGVPALDDNGKPTSYSYDAWGQRRDALSYSGPPVDTAPGGNADVTPRGYTGHEMLDGLGLVHMNGRIYDPLLGRFLSADTIVDGPGNLQGYNRYSYVKNNPLTYVDPTGHFAVAIPWIAEGAVWLTSAEATHLAAGLYTLGVAAMAKYNVSMLPYGGYSNNAYPYGMQMMELRRAEVAREQAQAAEMKAKIEAQSQSSAPPPAVQSAAPNPQGGDKVPSEPPSNNSKDKSPYINNNPKASDSEKEVGSKLHNLAQNGKLPGVSSVQGAPESGVQGVRSGDYRFTDSSGKVTRADLYEPAKADASKIAGHIAAKSGQAETVVVRLGAGDSSKTSLADLNSQVQKRVFETPGVKVDRVVIMSEKNDIVSDLTRSR